MKRLPTSSNDFGYLYDILVDEEYWPYKGTLYGKTIEIVSSQIVDRKEKWEEEKGEPMPDSEWIGKIPLEPMPNVVFDLKFTIDVWNKIKKWSAVCPSFGAMR